MGIILIATLALIANSPQAPSVPAQAHQDALAQFKSGMVALESERYDEAEAAFKKAVNLEPNYEGAYYGLGQTYMRKHLFEDAVQAYLHSREAFRQNAAAEAAGDVAADRRLAGPRVAHDRDPSHGRPPPLTILTRTLYEKPA